MARECIEQEEIVKRFGIVALMTILCFTGSALGQVGIYLGLDGGVSSQHLDLDDIEFDRDTTFVYGIKAGIRVLFLGLEAQYFQASHNINVQEFPDFGWADRSVNYNYAGINGKIFLPVPIVSPYLTLGYGTYKVKLEGLDEDKTSNFNFGLGLELKLGRHFALQGEWKYHPSSVNLENEDLKINDHTLMGGMHFYF